MKRLTDGPNEVSNFVCMAAFRELFVKNVSRLTLRAISSFNTRRALKTYAFVTRPEVNRCTVLRQLTSIKYDS